MGSSKDKFTQNHFTGCQVCLSLSNLLNKLDHADTVSLVEDDRTAKAIELSRESQRSKAFSVAIKPSSGGIAKGFPRALGWVQRVKSNAVDKTLRSVTQCWCF